MKTRMITRIAEYAQATDRVDRSLYEIDTELWKKFERVTKRFMRLNKRIYDERFRMVDAYQALPDDALVKKRCIHCGMKWLMPHEHIRCMTCNYPLEVFQNGNNNAAVRQPRAEGQGVQEAQGAGGQARHEGNNFNAAVLDELFNNVQAVVEPDGRVVYPRFIDPLDQNR